MKKILLVVILLIIILLPRAVSAEQKTDVDFYWKTGCKYCEEERSFLDGLQKDQPALVINRFDVSTNIQNAKKLIEEAKNRNFNPNSVPVTLIGKQVIIGFSGNETTGKQITEALKNPGKDTLSNNQTCDLDNATVCSVPEQKVKVPLLGEVNIKQYSLIGLTAVLGLTDGFNPCAMWALIALLGLLVTLKSRKKLILIGGTFLLTSYLIYLVFMAAWLNAFLYIGYFKAIQLIIGAVALVIGSLCLRDFMNSDPKTCQVVYSKTRAGWIEKAKKIVAHKWLIVSIIGVILLAVAVNSIEALCSVGIPAIYTKTLAEANLSRPAYYGYLSLYNVFYMADDIIVFSIAVITRRLIQPSNKYSYWGRLVGGIILIGLGLVFIFKPELLSL